LDLEVANDEEQSPRPIGGQYAGVAWGLAKRQDDPDAAPAS
jgi:hypothetical protein